MEKFEILLYSTPEGNANIDVFFEDDTFWLSQKRMAGVFNVDVRTINEHLKNIFSTNELQEDPTIRKFRIVEISVNSSSLYIVFICSFIVLVSLSKSSAICFWVSQIVSF